MSGPAIASITVTSLICAYGVGDLVYTWLHCRSMDRRSSSPSRDSMVGLWVCGVVLGVFWVGGVSAVVWAAGL